MGLKESGGSQDGWQLGLGPEYRARTWSRGVRVTGSGLQWSTFRIYSPLRSGKADTAGETRAPPGLPPKSGDMGTLWREAVRRRDLREGSRNATSRAFSTMKLQYFGHLMRRVDSLEKTLMLGGIGDRRRRGRQRMRWLDGITDSMDVQSQDIQASVTLKNSSVPLCSHFLP